MILEKYKAKSKIKPSLTHRERLVENCKKKDILFCNF